MTNYNRLDNGLKSKLDQFFDKWIQWDEENNTSAGGVQPKLVFANFKGDHFLDFKSYKKIIKFIVAKYSSFDEKLWAIKNFIWKNHLFKGGSIEERPRFLGTVINTEVFAGFLSSDERFRNFFDTPDEIYTFINDPSRELALNKDLKLVKLKESGRSVWMTWDEISSDRNPFSFSKMKKKVEIINALGLTEDYLNNQIALYVFSEVEQTYLKRPTVADANIDNLLWRPTPVSFTRYGLTEPLTHDDLSEEYDNKRPEAVIDSDNFSFNYFYQKTDHLI